MKIKKSYLIAGIIILFLIGWVFVRFVLGGGEDDWIRDDRGVYVMHGNPSEIPNYVKEQQEAITCALNKFDNFAEEISSQCLGTCGDYAIDIVHVPREDEDNLVENQCEDYGSGKVQYFIELNGNGEIVRIA